MLATKKAMERIKMNIKFSRNDDDDEEEDFSNSKKVQFYKRAIPSFEMIVNLNDCIRDPGHYFELVEEMESLNECDLVDFKTSSPGGRLDGLVYLLNAIKDCAAPVIGTLSGEAASAATVLLLACDGVRVKPYSTMMIHSASFGYVNHQSNMVNQATFVDKQARKILTDAYQDFLLPEELGRVFDGLEVRLGYEEINERLLRRDEIREQRLLEVIEQKQGTLKKPARKRKTPVEA